MEPRADQMYLRNEEINGVILFLEDGFYSDFLVEGWFFNRKDLHCINEVVITQTIDELLFARTEYFFTQDSVVHLNVGFNINPHQVDLFYFSNQINFQVVRVQHYGSAILLILYLWSSCHL